MQGNLRRRRPPARAALLFGSSVSSPPTSKSTSPKRYHSMCWRSSFISAPTISAAPSSNRSAFRRIATTSTAASNTPRRCWQIRRRRVTDIALEIASAKRVRSRRRSDTRPGPLQPNIAARWHEAAPSRERRPKMQTAALVSAGTTRYLEEIRRFRCWKPRKKSVLAKALARAWRRGRRAQACHQPPAPGRQDRRGLSRLRAADLRSDFRRQYRPDAGGQALRSAEGLSVRHLCHMVDQGGDPGIHLRSWSLVKMGTTANQKKLFFNLRKAKSKISALKRATCARPRQADCAAPRRDRAGRDHMNRRLGGDVSLNAPIRDDGDRRTAGLARRRGIRPGNRDWRERAV